MLLYLILTSTLHRNKRRSIRLQGCRIQSSTYPLNFTPTTAFLRPRPHPHPHLLLLLLVARRRFQSIRPVCPTYLVLACLFMMHHRISRVLGPSLLPHIVILVTQLTLRLWVHVSKTHQSCPISINCSWLMVSLHRLTFRSRSLGNGSNHVLMALFVLLGILLARMALCLRLMATFASITWPIQLSHLSRLSWFSTHPKGLCRIS
jgi:hypothetical protein